MKQAVLIIVKPDGIAKRLTGEVFNRFEAANLKMLAIRLAKVTRELAESHYEHIKGESFFEGVVKHLVGKDYKVDRVLAFVLYGENAIRVCRKIAGATNPEEAELISIRGAHGRITRKRVYENVVHVSSSVKDAKREIQMWFQPDEIQGKLYPVKTEIVDGYKVRTWK